jgi:hypothetical protein
MIGFITFILAFALLGLLLQVFRPGTYRDADTKKFKTRNLWRLFVALIAAWFIAIINPIDVERIDAGHVGIKVSNVGDNRGVGRTEYVTGWVFYNSWISRIYEFPIHQQHIDYEEADIVTRGGFRATIKPSFNYSINAGMWRTCFKTCG